MKTHWQNPWTEAVTVPIEELVECVYGIGERYFDSSGVYFIMTKEQMLSDWRVFAGDKLDAYILPGKNGMSHSIGIRYGNNGPEYLSPFGVQEKIQALLEKYSSN